MSSRKKQTICWDTFNFLIHKSLQLPDFKLSESEFRFIKTRFKSPRFPFLPSEILNDGKFIQSCVYVIISTKFNFFFFFSAEPVGKPYTLQGQISNKVTCIKDTISASTKLFLIGHSIGCYMILHMLKQLDSNRVLKCFQLFPTVERMALSPKGQTTTPMLRYFRWAAWPIVALPYFFIPDFVKRRILEWFFQDPTICPSAITGTMRLINPTSVCQSFNLAHEEMNTVLEADYELIREFASKLFWYYGAKDHWCPVEYYQDMKNRFPQMDIVLCKEGFEHAFVLKASKPMADLTWQWAENLLSWLCGK